MKDKNLVEHDMSGNVEKITDLQGVLEEMQLPEEKKEESATDWPSGVDVLEIGAAIVDAVGSLVSKIDLDL